MQDNKIIRCLTFSQFHKSNRKNNFRLADQTKASKNKMENCVHMQNSPVQY